MHSICRSYNVQTSEDVLTLSLPDSEDNDMQGKGHWRNNQHLVKNW